MAIGDIGAVLATLEFDTAFAEDMMMVHVADDVYAIAYRDTNSHGKLIAVTISADGTTLALAGGVLEFDAVRCYYPYVLHISGNVYAIAYSGDGSDGWIKTVTISADGTTIALTGNSWEFDGVTGNFPTIICVHETVHALVYADGYGDGWIKTFTIAADGTLTGAAIESYEFDVNGVEWTRILQVASNVFLVSYGDTAKDGWIKTFGISDGGLITTPFLDSYRFDDRYVSATELLHVKNDIFAMVSQDLDADGQITTVKVSATGVITEPYKGRLEFDPVEARNNSVVRVADGVYAIAYGYEDGDGKTATITISADGTTIALTGSSLEFDTASCSFPWIVHVSGNVYAIAYKGVDDDGFLKTVEIETVLPGKPGYLMIMGIG